MTQGGMRYKSAPDRRAHILARLREVGFLSCAELARDLSVSQMTVRRDLQLLESGGHVRIVHGGASLVPGLRGSFPGTDGGDDVQRWIASSAASLVGDDETIVIDAGAIGHHVVQALPSDFSGTVITHSLPVMQLLVERRPRSRLVALGGELMPARQAFAGPATLEAIRQLRARTFFLAAAAADARGLYARSVSEASVERCLMDIADRVVLLAPRDVFAGSAPALIGPLDRLVAVVSDGPPPHEVATAFRQVGVPVRIAATNGRVQQSRSGSSPAQPEQSS
jgi:DeoR family transcriptional regulator of aga operon